MNRRLLPSKNRAASFPALGLWAPRYNDVKALLKKGFVDRGCVKHMKNRMFEMRREHPELNLLRNRLLSCDGWSCCIPVEEEDRMEILDRGRIFTGRGSLLKKGEPIKCHSNAAFLWNSHRSEMRIATGYALSRDGIWRQHTWCVIPMRGQVVETTVRRVLYYGFVMRAKECGLFFEANAR